MIKHLLFTTFILASHTISASADAPKVPTNAPYIVLSNNLDEPNGFGFCIDTLSRGQTDLMQTHTCKPAREGAAQDDRDNDTRFKYDEETQQVTSYAFKGFCMQALIADVTTIFALLECNEHSRQKFIYNATDGSLRLNEDQERCVSAAPKTEPAGPWVKRSLRLTKCEETEVALRQWTVVAVE